MLREGKSPFILFRVNAKASEHRHYEDCWNELAKMFSSTTTLPPRTKRWAEAKVLADCVAVRVSSLPRTISCKVPMSSFVDLQALTV